MLKSRPSYFVSRKFLFLVLAFFLTLNFATSGGHLFSIDDSKYFLHTENLFFEKSLELNPFSPSAKYIQSEDGFKHTQQVNYRFQGKEWNEETPLEPFFDWSNLLISFFTLPLYYISFATSTNAITNLSFFTNSIILSLVSLMIFLLSMNYFHSKKISFILSLVFLVTTWVWQYNTGMQFRPLTALLLILGFYFIVTSKNDNSYRPIISGLCIGLTILSSYSAFIYLPGLTIFGIYNFRKNKKSIFLFLVSISLLLFSQALLNEVRFGAYTDFGFGEFGNPVNNPEKLQGVIGYFFSLGWGIFFNAPLLILFPVAVFLAIKRNLSLGLFLLYLILASWLFFGTLGGAAWSGYGGSGPRYVTTILPMLILSLGFIFEKFSKNNIFKFSFVGLAVFGFFVSFMSKLVWYRYGYSYAWLVLKTHLIEDGWLLQNYDISYLPITTKLMFLSTNFVERIPTPYSFGAARGLAPCPYDLFIYCNVGIIPFLIILICLCVLGFFILKILRKELPQSKVELNGN